MSTDPNAPLPADDLLELKDSWSQIVERTVDQQSKALFAGVNFRLNVAQGLKAVWKATTVFFRTKKAVLLGGPGLSDLLHIGADVIGLVSASLEAIREKVHKLEYVACFVLSGEETPVAPTVLREHIEAFVRECQTNPRPWYTGLTDSVIAEATKAMGDPNWFEALLKLLRAHDWLIENGGLLAFKRRDFEWGFCTR